MKSLHLADTTDRPVLIEGEVPVPEPQPGEVLVRVHAAGVTPTELLWYPTSHTKEGGSRHEAVPAHEISGEIVKLGEGVGSFAVGQHIYGMNDWFAEGALAEYCITRPEFIAAKPQRLTFVDAASVPIGALTAWQGLYERAGLKAGERVLVHGGAGAVGVYAIQLAHARGAYVITTASAQNADLVKQLGADEWIDYRRTPFERQVHDLDVVFDTVGGETLERSWSVLKPGGRMVTIAADVEGAEEERLKQAFFIVEARREELEKVSAMLDAEALRPVVDTVLEWSQAADAYTGKVAKKGRGKMVVALTKESAARSASLP